MAEFFTGLFAIAVAVGIQRLFLDSWRVRLLAKEQAFSFHALRDQLQMLAILGHLAPDSEAYQSLMGMLNVGIRNAGKMKLSDIVEITKRLKPERGTVVEEIGRQGETVRKLAAECYWAFGKMLLVNDSIVRVGIFIWKHFPNEVVKDVAQKVAPVHATAVSRARRYQTIAQNLASC